MSFHATKQRAIDFIRSHTLAKGEAPSMREIAHGIGQASPGSVHRMVAALEAEGKLRRMPGKRRSIELVPVSGTILVELPADLYSELMAIADQAQVSIAATCVEAIRDGLAQLKTRQGVARPAAVRRGVSWRGAGVVG